MSAAPSPTASPASSVLPRSSPLPSLPHRLGWHHAWAQQPQWRVLALETDALTAAHHVLGTWQAWQQDAQRPQRLHYVLLFPQALHADALRQHFPATHPLHPFAALLAPQLFGLLPGVHRISLEGGQLLLTLWLGDHQAMLRQQSAVFDSIWLDRTACAPADAHLAKALARHCRRGTTVDAAPAQDALWPALQSCGFVAATRPRSTAAVSTASAAPATATAPACTHARFDPAWQPRQRHSHLPEPVRAPGHALVLGAGLAGSAAAHSLAQRGWQVTVLVAGDAPADGASGLPAGLFCPHVSPDDSVLSRLSRNGVRMTLERLRQLCTEGYDWAPSGVLEHCTDGGTGLPASWTQGPGADWSHPASPDQLAHAGLPPDTVACWHPQAGWVRPAQLVHAQLQHPQIRVLAHAAVAQLQRSPDGGWCALDAQEQVLATADIAVLATGPATASLLPQGMDWALQPIRGQITWGLHTADNASALPPFPVNGNGNLVTQVPQATGQEPLWVMGSTFERDVTALPISTADQAAAHTVNHGKLSTLLPASGAAMAPWFDPQNPHCQPTWGRVRVASHDRLPIAGPVDAAAYPGLWAVTALGSRGLTLSVLCGELLAAQLHGEPLPLDAKLAQHLGTERLHRRG